MIYNLKHVAYVSAFKILRLSCYRSYRAEKRQETVSRGGVEVTASSLNQQVVGSRPATALSFSHVDVHIGVLSIHSKAEVGGSHPDAFQFIIHMPVASCLLSSTYD